MKRVIISVTLGIFFITIFSSISTYGNESKSIDEIKKEIGHTSLDSKNSKKNRNKQYPSISGNFVNGGLIPTNDFVRGENILGMPLKNHQSLSAKMLWQNPGYTEWQRTFNMPYYGFGLSINNFYDYDEIGLPSSIYGVLGLPIKRWDKVNLNAEFQFGVALGWTHYDEIENPYNLAIGASATIHVAGGLNVFYQVSNNIELGAGISFLHFSNGGLERPNRGLNLFSPSIELKYHINGKSELDDYEKPVLTENKDQFYVMMSYSSYQAVEHELDSVYYEFYGISGIYLHKFTKAFRMGPGVDFNYWMGLNADENNRTNGASWENLTIGVILQPEVTIDRLTLVGGIGIYAKHHIYGNFKKMYQRLGVRFDISDHVAIGMNVRAVNFMLAETLEFNIGYTFGSCGY